MKKLTVTHKLAAFALSAIVFAAGSALAAERGTPEEAKALVASAIALYDKVGRNAAFAAFNDPNGIFVDRDLYVFVFGPDRKLVAHGGDPSQVGTEADSLRDVNGVAFGKLFMDQSTETGIWVDYEWKDPVSGTVLPKTSWVVRHDGYVFGAGVYKP